jgi:hypothetical protein
LNNIYFAWVGGDPIPAVDLETTGDIWSGSVNILTTVWGGSLTTTGDILSSTTLSNLFDITGLVAGETYTITGTGIPSILNGDAEDTTLAFDGANGGTLSQDCTIGELLSVTLARSAGRTAAILDDISLLVNGLTYGISGSGITLGSEFEFTGSVSIILSLPAITTGQVLATVSNQSGIDTINNLGDTTDLISGLTYEVFAQGLPAGAEATYNGDATLTLLVKPTRSGTSVPLSIVKGKTYPDGGAFNELVHLREDEEIISLDINHTEGGFAELSIDVRNPRVGLLGAGRNLWCWLSWRNDADVVIPLFHGRLIGVPENLQNEEVRLNFIARPNDFVEQKILLANDLRILPYWDPVWLIDRINDPDTVLEARSKDWHIDPVTLEVSASDILVGEDSTIDVLESEHIYEAMTVSYGATPLRRVNVTAAVGWNQIGEGDVDLTDELVSACQLAGSPSDYPLISSYTADGLVSAWPKPKTSIGGGWTIGEATTAAISVGDKINYIVTYTDRTDLAVTYSYGPIVLHEGGGDSGLYTEKTQKITGANWKNYDVFFALQDISVNLSVHYDANRKRSETISFSVHADIQSILTDPFTAENESINLSSNFVDQNVEPDGTMPLVDARRNLYFPTDRGQESIKYLILLAAARLMARARAVDITFTTTWEKMAGVITCRKNVRLYDYRLSGGVASGKVKSYKITMFHVEVTIGCSIGYGVELVPSAGVNSYIDDYIDNYYEVIGGQISIVEGKILYSSMDGTYILDDDGINLFDMSSKTVIDNLLIVGGPNDQESVINESLSTGGNLAAIGDTLGTGNGIMGPVTVTTSAAIGVYKVKILDPVKSSAAVYNPNKKNVDITVGTSTSVFSVTNPNGVQIGTGILGSLFKAGGISFKLEQGTTAFVPGDEIDITVSVALSDRAGLTSDPIGALSALPTSIRLSLVSVTGGDFETDYVVKVSPLVIPQTIDLEHV